MSPANKEKPIIEGDLYKQSVDKRGNQIWKKRRFVLYSDRLVYYRDGKMSMLNRKQGVMKLTEEFWVQDTNLHENGFTVTNYTQAYNLAATDPELKTYWMHSTARILRGLQEKANFFAGVDLHKNPNAERTKSEKEKDLQKRMEAYKQSQAKLVAKEKEGKENKPEDTAVVEKSVEEKQSEQVEEKENQQLENTDVVGKGVEEKQSQQVEEKENHQLENTDVVEKGVEEKQSQQVEEGAIVEKSVEEKQNQQVEESSTDKNMEEKQQVNDSTITENVEESQLLEDGMVDENHTEEEKPKYEENETSNISSDKDVNNTSVVPKPNAQSNFSDESNNKFIDSTDQSLHVNKITSELVPEQSNCFDTETGDEKLECVSNIKAPVNHEESSLRNDDNANLAQEAQGEDIVDTIENIQIDTDTLEDSQCEATTDDDQEIVPEFTDTVVEEVVENFEVYEELEIEIQQDLVVDQVEAESLDECIVEMVLCQKPVECIPVKSEQNSIDIIQTVVAELVDKVVLTEHDGDVSGKESFSSKEDKIARRISLSLSELSTFDTDTQFQHRITMGLEETVSRLAELHQMQQEAKRSNELHQERMSELQELKQEVLEEKEKLKNKMREHSEQNAMRNEEILTRLSNSYLNSCENTLAKENADLKQHIAELESKLKLLEETNQPKEEKKNDRSTVSSDDAIEGLSIQTEQEDLNKKCNNLLELNSNLKQQLDESIQETNSFKIELKREQSISNSFKIISKQDEKLEKVASKLEEQCTKLSQLNRDIQSEMQQSKRKSVKREQDLIRTIKKKLEEQKRRSERVTTERNIMELIGADSSVHIPPVKERSRKFRRSQQKFHVHKRNVTPVVKYNPSFKKNRSFRQHVQSNEVKPADLKNKIALWNSRTDVHKETIKSQTQRKIVKRGSMDYGKPVPGSKTEERAIAAKLWVDKEIDKLMQVIQEKGESTSDGSFIIKFGPLFVAYQDISDTLVGILMRAKKRKKIFYEGDMLFQGAHNNVIIKTLVSIAPEVA